MIEQVAKFVESGQFATGAEARVDCQYPFTSKRGLEEQAAQIARENLNSVMFRFLGQFVADFSFQARQE